jgi:acyl-coenzyme A thioesterase PaaI-like protein
MDEDRATAAPSIQERFVPDGICFGCGPANGQGLGLRSRLVDAVVVAQWQPEPQHAAVPGVLCGGVISTLVDCHSAAALAQHVKDVEGRWPWAQSPGWATAELTVAMLRPAPLEHPVQLVADAVELAGDERSSGSSCRVTATCGPTAPRGGGVSGAEHR